MLETETLVGFVAASLALAVAPGPDNLFVLTRSALQGSKAGLVVTMGLCTGLVFHTLAVALGVAAMFQSSATAFSILKYGGAGYMLYLAWRTFHAGPSKRLADHEPPVDLSKLYRQGVILNVTNPKVSIFFLAFLPQFVDPVRGSVFVQIVAFGGLFIACTILVFGAISLVSGTLHQRFVKSERLQLALNKCASVVFVAIALKLALAQRHA